MSKLLVLLLAVGSIGCTDAFWDKTVGKLGIAAEIHCYSGGKLVFADESTGAIASASQSDGWQYRSKKTGKYMEVSADCILMYKE